MYQLLIGINFRVEKYINCNKIFHLDKTILKIYAVILWCVMFSCYAQNGICQQMPFIINNDGIERNDLSSYVYILEDTTKNLQFKDVKKSSFNHNFHYLKKLKLKFLRDKVYWLKIPLKNRSYRDHWIMYIGKGSDIQLFSPNTQGLYTKKLNGDQVPRHLRDIKNHIVEFKYSFNLYLRKHRTTLIYVRISNKLYPPRLTLKLERPDVYFSKSQRLTTIQGIFQGALWIILLYNAILFLIVKDRTYVYYVIYIFSYSIYYLCYYGFFSVLPYLQTYISALSSQSSMICYFLFMQLFVNAKEILRGWNKIINYWLFLKTAFTIVLTAYIYITFKVMEIELYLLMLYLIDVILFITTFILLIRTKNTLARYFVAGSFFLMLGWGLSALSFFGLITVDQNENYFSQAGLFLELVLFSVGLGYRERKNEEEKRLAQEENARILKEQNVTLERKVKERTIEITEKNEELMVQKEEILTQRDALQERGEELQFAYNQITDSVRYAQTIQNAILPFEQKIKRVFEDYFIIFYPKDIVSGDFYWFNTIDDSEYPKAVVSAIDCTGHGVPGAFMSMIGNTLLNETINEKRIFDPAEVLTRLHDKIRQDLRQAETNNSDGMDMALCVVEQMPDQNYKLTFSGAKRPLYYIHEGELEQLKADRFSIGGEVDVDERERIFTNIEIILNKGDMFYMLTDGFGDTPGMDRKRFGSRNIKKMISAAKELSMPDQKENFEQTLANHMGDQEARDDVTFLGFKI